MSQKDLSDTVMQSEENKHEVPETFIGSKQNLMIISREGLESIAPVEVRQMCLKVTAP